MPTFDITFMRVDRDEDPTIVEGFFRTVDWPVLPREGEGLDIGAGLDPVTVESVGFDFEGYPNVVVRRRSRGARRPAGGPAAQAGVAREAAAVRPALAGCPSPTV